MISKVEQERRRRGRVRQAFSRAKLHLAGVTMRHQFEFESAPNPFEAVKRYTAPEKRSQRARAYATYLKAKEQFQLLGGHE